MLHKVQFKNSKIKFLTKWFMAEPFSTIISLVLFSLGRWMHSLFLICSFQPRAYFKFCYNARDKGVIFQFNYHQKHYKNDLPTTHLVNQHPHNN